MSDITLEKIDILRERTGISYSESKEALEACNGDVVEALIYVEQNQSQSKMEKVTEFHTSKDEFKDWLKDTIRRGNVSRIKIRNSKDNKVIVDVPVNAGIAAGLFGLVWTPLLAIGLVTAIVTRVTIEITRNDGSVEVVNKVIKDAVKDINHKVQDLKGDVVLKKENIHMVNEDEYEITLNGNSNNQNYENMEEKERI